jgi:hypothetical protein
MRQGHLHDLQTIMRSATVLEKDAVDLIVPFAGPAGKAAKAQTLATLAVSKRLEALIHCLLYNSPEDEDELG